MCEQLALKAQQMGIELATTTLLVQCPTYYDILPHFIRYAWLIFSAVCRLNMANIKTELVIWQQIKNQL